jgi:putative AlgH/UPF0301 family transcriptional regulator
LIKPGDLIISHPRWGSSIRSVCFITEHTRYSTVALQINQPAKVTLRELVFTKGYDCADDQMVYSGGEFSPGALIMLHDRDWYSSNTMPVTSEWSISSDYHMLDKVTMGNTPTLYRYVMGLTAWEPGALEKDLHSDRPRWILLNDPDPELVMADADNQYALAIHAASSQFWNDYI